MSNNRPQGNTTAGITYLTDPDPEAALAPLHAAASTYRIALGPKHAEVWARVDNVFDSDYEAGGTQNFNGFADPIAVERFLAPGAPRAGWVGVKLRF